VYIYIYIFHESVSSFAQTTSLAEQLSPVISKNGVSQASPGSHARRKKWGSSTKAGVSEEKQLGWDNFHLYCYKKL